jgi:hypothetical protein
VAGWYLSQTFATDIPGTQVFLAPGPEEQPLSPSPSPWIVGRMVRVPARYWHRLLIALRDIDPMAANILDAWSGSAEPDEPGERHATPEKVAVVRQALHELAARLRAGAAVTDGELDALGPYTREDVTTIGDSVVRVFDEATAADAPFSAWPE